MLEILYISNFCIKLINILLTLQKAVEDRGLQVNELLKLTSARYFLSFDGVSRKWYTNEDTDAAYNTVKIPMQDSAEYSASELG